MKILFAILLLASTAVFAEPQLPAHIRTLDAHSICTPRTSTIRDVSARTKWQIYKRDGVPGGNHTGICSGKDGCEIDHRVSLQLGGSNDPSNLMVQPFNGKCNARDKDRLENALHRMICSNKIGVKEAQDLIYNDWERGYRLYINNRGCGK